MLTRLGFVETTMSALISTESAASPPSHGRPGACACLLPYRQLPPRSDEMACVSVWDALQVILVFRLRFPEGSRRSHLGDHSSGPQARRVDIGDGVLGDASLLIAGREDGRAVAGAHVVALAIARRGIVDLEEELQQLTKAEPFRIEDDLDGFGVGSVMAIRSIRNITARITDASGDDAIALADEVLHTP